METFWGLSVTTWTAIYTILTALLLITAWGAAGIAWGQWKVSRDAVAEARRAQLEANRPYVIVTVESIASARNLFELSVKNIGKRPALNVRVRLDPAPVVADSTPGYEIAELKMLREPIAMIAPEQDMRTFWDDHIARSGRADLPDSHRVALSYSDSSGRVYQEESVLDLAAMQGAAYVESKSIHDIGKTLDKIAKTLNGASILARTGRAEVLAVTETREANEYRNSQYLYQQLLSSLRLAKARGGGDRKEIEDLEIKVARMEKDIPGLKEQASSPATSDADSLSLSARASSGRVLLTVRQRLRALLGYPSCRK